MARPLRLEYPGACYHVINRGNYRRNVFAPKGAAEAFERCLDEVAVAFGWRIHAYVIMRNHFHLAVETPRPNLSAGMKWLQGTWATRFNRFLVETGRPFQGRYKSLHVESGEAMARVAHYIHLNPVRAKVVPADRIEEYKRSSLPLFSRKNRPVWLAAETVLDESGGLPDTAAGWRKYREYLAFLSEDDVKLRENRLGKLSRGWVVGSTEFEQGLRKNLMKLGRDWKQVRLLGGGLVPELPDEYWATKLKEGARLFKIKLDRLPTKKSAIEKVRLAAFMKVTMGVSNAWLAKKLAMGQPASVSQFVRRFKLAGEDRKKEFTRILSSVTS
jgi:REP element-mobilizing transposase RayT